MTSNTPIYPNNNFSSYGYEPSLIMAAIFLSLFAISASCHLYQSIKRRSLLFMLCMVVGCAIELIGWGGRVWSRYAPDAKGYMMQMYGTIQLPNRRSHSQIYAALYALLALVIATVAPNQSPLSSKMFKIVFITADVFALVLQGAGGGIAATATSESLSHAGSHLMLAGIVFQLVVMLVFFAYTAWFYSRARKEFYLAGKRVIWLFFGVGLSSFMIIVRGAYRTAELAGGFKGTLARNQYTFLLDAIPVTIATFAINVWHPCMNLPMETELAGLPKVNSEIALKQEGADVDARTL
ncbi:hypothetical protein T439DRAFT_375693 [Meredithblackwellia eburnea MCA 4105]